MSIPRHRRIVLIGQAPSRRADPDRPLIGGASGGMLYRLAGAMSLRQYASWFERRNLLRGWPGAAAPKGDLFPLADARQAAAQLLQQLGGRKVVLLGSGVAAAFGFDAKTPRLAWFERGGTTWALCPHPSPVNRWWNETTNKVAAAKFFGRAVREL